MGGGLKETLEELYARFNRREYVRPDPLQFLYQYDDVRDREIAGLAASSLAFGRVAQILKSVSSMLDRMGSSPRRFLDKATRASLKREFTGFKHRWATGDELADMLFGAKKAMEKYGSLHECFAAGRADDDDTVIPALSAFVEELGGSCKAGGNRLISSPGKGSACKRLNLYLRWMVRRDAVDPGGWDDIPASILIVPVDTHMHRLCLGLDFTRRKQADLRTAIEVTGAFRNISPDDPVRYDFALTRLGIREDADPVSFLARCASSRGNQND